MIYKPIKIAIAFKTTKFKPSKITTDMVVELNWYQEYMANKLGILLHCNVQYIAS